MIGLPDDPTFGDELRERLKLSLIRGHFPVAVATLLTELLAEIERLEERQGQLVRVIDDLGGDPSGDRDG